MGSDTPSWQYAQLDDCEHEYRASWTWRARECFGSRTFWRIILSFTCLMVVVDLCQTQTTVGRLILPGLDKVTHGSHSAIISDDTDWSQYAYCYYVTTLDYLCNSVMIFEALDRAGAKAAKVMLFPSTWSVTDNNQTAVLIRKARDEYGAQLSPIQVQHLSGDETWAASFTKLLAFNQTQYKRVLSLDSDATVLQSMDELFLLPSAPVAMPRAYWLDNTLSSQMLLIKPSAFEFKRIQTAVDARGLDDFDMEIVNTLYGNDSIVVPHRRYDLVTGEFRATDHARYLGSTEEVWDPTKVIDEAKFVHFSDWPMPKPWLPHTEETEMALRPACKVTADGQDCRARDIWLYLYADFVERRKVRAFTEVCW